MKNVKRELNLILIKKNYIENKKMNRTQIFSAKLLTGDYTWIGHR